MYHYSIVSKLDMTSLWFSVCQSRFPSGKTLIDQLNKISWLTVQETQKISKNAAMVHSFFGFVSFSHVQWQKFRGMWAVEWLHLVYALQLTNLWVFNWWASWSNLCVAALLPALSLKKKHLRSMEQRCRFHFNVDANSNFIGLCLISKSRWGKIFDWNWGDWKEGSRPNYNIAIVYSSHKK